MKTIFLCIVIPLAIVAGWWVRELIRKGMR